MPEQSRVRCSAPLYHHVGPQSSGIYPGMSIEPRKFEKQMTWLKRRGYTAILPDQWCAWRNGSAGIPLKPVMITFDDAYADIAEYALPVLKHHGFTATVFVVTDRIGAANTWDADNGFGALPLMTEEQIRTWAAAGFAFGAHGRTHRDLTTLDGDALTDEIAGSASDLERLLGKPAFSFAYPFGAWNDRVLSIASEHFPLAFSCLTGTNTLETDPHLLRRVFLPTHISMVDFALSVRTGGQHRLSELRVRFALRTRLRRLFRR